MILRRLFFASILRCGALKQRLIRLGANPAMMSGSGSSVFGIFDGLGTGSSRHQIFSKGNGFPNLAGEPRTLPIPVASLAGSAPDTIRMAAPKPVRAMNPDRIKIFTGSANPALAEEMCGCLGLPLGKASLRQFADGEINLQILENVRGADVFVVQPTCTPVDRHLMELLLMIDALKRSSAERITAVLPYYGYARQDRKDKPRVPISAKLVASLIETGGRGPDSGAGFTCGADSGFFRYPGGPFVLGPGDDRLFQAAGDAAPDGGFAGRGRCGARPGVRQAAEGAAGDHR